MNDDVFIIGDRVRFRADGIPGPMTGTIVDLGMGYALVEGPDGKRYMRSLRDVEDVPQKKSGRTVTIIK